MVVLKLVYLDQIRFLPFFFGLGAALEFSMINWTVSRNFHIDSTKRSLYKC